MAAILAMATASLVVGNLIHVDHEQFSCSAGIQAPAVEPAGGSYDRSQRGPSRQRTHVPGRLPTRVGHNQAATGGAARSMATTLECEQLARTAAPVLGIHCHHGAADWGR